MITHHILERKGYAYIEIVGSPDLEEYIKAASIFVQDPNYSSDLDRICDFSQADLSKITLTEINQFANFAIENIPIQKTTKVALVSPSEGKKGIFEAFMAHMDMGMFKLFTDPEDAVTWAHDHQ